MYIHFGWFDQAIVTIVVIDRSASGIRNSINVTWQYVERGWPEPELSTIIQQRFVREHRVTYNSRVATFRMRATLWRKHISFQDSAWRATLVLQRDVPSSHIGKCVYSDSRSVRHLTVYDTISDELNSVDKRLHINGKNVATLWRSEFEMLLHIVLISHTVITRQCGQYSS